MFPFIYNSDGFFIPTYGLFQVLAFLLLLYWTRYEAGRRGLDKRLIVPELAAMALGGALLGNAVAVLLLPPAPVLDVQTLIWLVWQTKNSIGAGIGAVLGCWLFLVVKRQPVLGWADAAAPGAALGYAVLRLGCFAAGCCFGKPCDLPWAVTFDAPFHPSRGAPVHPTQIYYALAAALTFAALLWAKPRLTRPGALAGMFLACYGAFSLVIAFFRADHQPWLLGLSGSQAVLGALVIIGCALIARPGRK
jgi:phosphatidylglycerol---prolipoprotein diacylglyceryl transferase